MGELKLSFPNPPSLSPSAVNVKIFQVWLCATGVGANPRNVSLNWHHSCYNQLQEDTITTSHFINFIKTETFWTIRIYYD